VQHGAGTLHAHENGNGWNQLAYVIQPETRRVNWVLTQEEPGREADDNGNDTSNATHLQARTNGHAPQNNTELLMSQGQSPKTEVRRSVGNTVQAEFFNSVSIRDWVL
jgi:hypothetical protein